MQFLFRNKKINIFFTISVKRPIFNCAKYEIEIHEKNILARFFIKSRSKDFDYLPKTS